MSRNKKTKVRNGSLNWRHDLYQGQRKLEKSRCSLQEYFQLQMINTLKPGNTTVALTLLMLGGGLLQMANGQTMPLNGNKIPQSSTCTIDSILTPGVTLPIEQQLESAITVDPNIPKAMHPSLNCAGISQAFFNSGLPMEPINRVLSNANFGGIECTDEETIRNRVGAGAFFSTADHKIRISWPKDFRVFYHEFIHADTYLRHIDEPCPTLGEEDAFVPFYPSNQQALDNYNKALDKGDSRLKTFKALLEKENKQHKLTPGELRILEKYKAAVKGCPNTILIKTSLEAYDNLIKKGWRPGLKNVTLFYHGTECTLLKAEKGTTSTFVTLQASNLAEMVCYIPIYTKEKLQNDLKYNNLDPLMKVAERDAYTFQGLSNDAAEFIYRDANALRNADIQRCTPRP